MNKTFNHSFAKVWLHYTNQKIFAGRRQILTTEKLPSVIFNVYKRYMQPLYPKMFKGEQTVDSEVGNPENIIPIYYSELKRKNLCIAKVDATNLPGKKPRQQFFYVISPNMANAIPRENVKGILEFDKLHKAVRYRHEFAGTRKGIFGRGGKTPWYYVYKRTPDQSYKPTSTQDYIDFITDSWQGKERQIEQELITLKNEVAVMVLNDDRLLCIERKKTPFRALFCGELGSGKSLGTSAILDQVHHSFSWEETKKNDFCIMMNDSNNQFYRKSERNDSKMFIKQLKKYGLEPRPAPAINLYMGCPNLKMEFEDEGISFRLVTDYLRFLKNFDYFSDGIKEFQLKGAERYLHHVYESNKTFKDAEDIIKYLLTEVEELQAKQYRPMLNKWKSTFTKVFEKEFLSNIPGTEAEWKLERNGEVIKANPIIISAEAGLFPIVNTTQAKRYDYFKNTQADFLKQLIEYQNNRPEGDRRRLYVGVDEMRTIYEEGMGSTHKVSKSKEAIIEIFREGRFNNIGFVGNTQNYHSLHIDMQTHCTHLFQGLSKGHKERKLIQKNFDIDEEEAGMINELETFEFLAICKQDYPFKIYDTDGSFKYEHGAFKGKIIPPLSIHLRGEK